MARLISYLLGFGLLAYYVAADCVSAGVDFSNGGTYNIDQSDNNAFTFTTVFQGCQQTQVEAMLVSPSGDQYVCSTISSQNGVEQTSNCGIPKSAMYSGDWTIVMHANGFTFDVQRKIHLNVGQPETVIVTVRPTIVVGVTSTAPAQTILQTIVQTATILYAPVTVTQQCGNPGAVQTITEYENGPIFTVTNTREQVITNAETSYYQTTVVSTAYCHWPTQAASSSDAPWTSSWGGGSWGGGGWGGGRGGGGRFRRRGAAAIAAVTSTYVDVNNPVTSTLWEIVAGGTSTSVVYQQTTTTVMAPAQTVCNSGSRTVTVIHQGEPQTQTTDVNVQRTTHITQWVGQTQYSTVTDQNQATQCWQGGGNYY